MPCKQIPCAKRTGNHSHRSRDANRELGMGLRCQPSFVAQNVSATGAGPYRSRLRCRKSQVFHSPKCLVHEPRESFLHGQAVPPLDRPAFGTTSEDRLLCDNSRTCGHRSKDENGLDWRLQFASGFGAQRRWTDAPRSPTTTQMTLPTLQPAPGRFSDDDWLKAIGPSDGP